MNQFKTNTKEVIEYFASHEIKMTDKFSLEKFRLYHDLILNDATVLLCNLEEEKIMNDIANGDYTSFNMDNPIQFNDSYDDMMIDLGFREDSEEEEED